jgi:hypothetical protein
MDMRFGLWNVMSFLMTASRELATYKFDLVGVQEVRWEGGGIELGQVFICIRESYQQLRGLSFLVIGCYT